MTQIAAVLLVALALGGCTVARSHFGDSDRNAGEGPRASLSMGGLARPLELTLVPQRRSIHLGETLLCRVILTPEGVKRVADKGSPVKWKAGESILEIPFRPVAVGTQDIGPIELKLSGIAFLSDSIPVTILPSLGTNDLMEVRVLDRKVREGQPIEVVFQWQKFERLRFPSPPEATLPVEESTPASRSLRGGWGSGGGGPLVRTADWKVYRDVPGNKFSYMRRDADGVYLLEGGIQSYIIRPVRSGQLILTMQVFEEVSRVAPQEPRLPTSFAFEPIVITVGEGSNNALEGDRLRPPAPQR